MPARSVSKTDRYRDVDFRKHPERYTVGRGEEGVLTAQPYKSELLPLWRFRTPAIALKSAKALYKAFLDYRAADDFVGMDLARKFLQMGYTRARRYANHRSGQKYNDAGEVLPVEEDREKAESAATFLPYWKRADAEPAYAKWKMNRLAEERAKRKANA